MLKIGIVGIGTVGTSLLKLLEKQTDKIKIVAIVDRSFAKKKSLIKDIPASGDIDFILKDDSIQAIVELTGGIDFPLFLTREALDRGKHVITANKALLAMHGYPLLNKAIRSKLSIRYEAAVAGAVPIIHNLAKVFCFEQIDTLEGILNGTSNYILTKMRKEKSNYESVLKQAQDLGFAEADPALDVGGEDAAHKLAILSSIIEKKWIEYQRITVRGIAELKLSDISWAEKMGYRIKLIAKYERRNNVNPYVSVEPTMISSGHFLWDVEYENNAIFLKTEFSQSHLFVGKGAGGNPTAYSVLADILRLYADPEEDSSSSEWKYGSNNELDNLESPFYLRLAVMDVPGVMAQIAQILGSNDISIASLQQDQKIKSGDVVELVIVTHSCNRGKFLEALKAIETQSFVKEKCVYLPIDERN